MSNKVKRRKYLVIYLTIAIFSGTLILALLNNVKEDTRISGDFQENLLWGVSQGEPDLLHFLNVLQRFTYGDMAVSHDDVMSRFDILWSRIQTLVKGTLGKALREIPKVGSTAERAMRILRHTEPRVASLKRGEVVKYRDISSEYQGLDRELHIASLNTSSYINYKILERRDHSRYQIKRSIILFIGILLSGGLLIFLLVREIRTSTRLLSVSGRAREKLHNQRERLQELVNTRTAALLAAKDEAEEANMAKSKFLASMSHELRTPLNAVIGFAQLLQLDSIDPLSPAQNERLECIISGGRHLLELVNDILDLAKVEANKTSFDLEEVAAGEVVADCVVMTSPLGKGRDIKIINQFSNVSTASIRTDLIRFKQVMLNLLSNAIKYNKDGGTVTVNGRETGNGFVHISITDTGIGIAKKDYQVIFEMFHRLDNDPMITQEGTGVGLALTRLLVEQMAGRIGFESEVGQGSTFWIELPLASNEKLLTWAGVLSTGIDAIDEDHRLIFSLLNRLSSRTVGNADTDEIIEELIEYTVPHFGREEAIMDSCAHPDLAEHRGLHLDFIAKTEYLSDTWRENRDPKTIDRLCSLLRNWLFNHIMKVDTKIPYGTTGKDQSIRKVLDSLEQAQP